MLPKKLLSLQDILNACLESDNEESDLKIDSDDSLNKDNSEKINSPQLIKHFDEEQAVLRDSVFLAPKSPPPTTTDCVQAPATTAVFLFLMKQII